MPFRQQVASKLSLCEMKNRTVVEKIVINLTGWKNLNKLLFGENL